MFTDVVADLSDLAQRPSVELALRALREHIGMDVAFVSEITGDRSTLRTFAGDGASFSMRDGASLPNDQIYCHHMLLGALPQVIPDTRSPDLAVQLPITDIADIGAYISAPLRFSDGRVFGTLCAANHRAKPELGERDLQFLQVVARIVADQLEREGIEGLTRQLQSQAAAVAALRAAVAARDRYTGEHSEAVVEHAVAVGRLLGLDGEDLVDVARIALLHDIGKIAIPDAILHKQGPLTADEWTVMRTHPVSSEELMASVPDLAHLATAVRSEHERWDGRGYPDGIAGERIPLASRITLVCDAFHAMISDRPYRGAMPRDRALAEIETGTGSQFCPAAAGALLELLRG